MEVALLEPTLCVCVVGLRQDAAVGWQVRFHMDRDAAGQELQKVRWASALAFGRQLEAPSSAAVEAEGAEAVVARV